jgi:hypothetical protein
MKLLSHIARILPVCVSTFLLAMSAQAASDQDVVQAKWKPAEIRYSYTGFTTGYDCLAFQSKMKSILRTLGAHPQTKVLATGCPIGRVSRNFFVTITTAMPMAADQADTSSADKSRQELLDKLGVKNDLSGQFPAAWKRVDLSEDRRLDLEPGDCELMDGLKRELLPKLGIKIVEDRVVCTPRQVSIDTPKLVVEALMPLQSADTAGTKTLQ